MSFTNDTAYQQWVDRYHRHKGEAEGRLRQARDRIEDQRDGMANLLTEIQADTSGRITQTHLDEVQAQIDRMNSWITSINAALSG